MKNILNYLTELELKMHEFMRYLKFN